MTNTDSDIQIKVPQAGESVQEAMIGSWLKKSGDEVAQDEPIVELETDKASMEVVAESAGILHILPSAKEGAVVAVGDVIALLKAKDTPTSSSEDSSPSLPSSQNAPLSKHGPAVNRLQQEHHIDLGGQVGSGKDGRLTKGDVLELVSSAAATPISKQPPVASQPGEPQPGEPQPSEQRQSTRTPMSMIRRRIADRLLDATQQTAMLTTFNEVDMSAVLDLRKRYKDSFQKQHGIKLGFMGFFIKASVHALQQFPKVNASIADRDIISHNYVDIGVAVSTDHGLVVPVLRDVQHKNIHDIEVLVAHYAQKARDKKLSLQDMQGGTFTITNGGVFGSLLSTPILNPPQSAILGMHKTELRPVVTKEGGIEPRAMMYLALSYDHRIVDGKEAVQFLVSIKNTIEDPSRFLLGI
ncbi:MAG: 2-oxoglutarate dehydrogenase complex dihydrolipoyllysine-residue succinyltransferase [Proteobacteria bacterium]|nr:2-oxoglutarate dehydrogenase complex dihydrolipoyllysine-residue succinyltransferase [Pseudomonadota bacterium]